MLSFKRALVVAAAILACMFLFTTLHQSSFSLRSLKTEVVEKQVGLDTSKKQQNKEHITKPKVLEDLRGGLAKQKPLSNPGTTVADRLRYQYPYDPAGKFPAYVWQTWKDSPSSGKFSENLRPMEASWTEKHPGFVHEVINDSTARRLVRYLYSSIPEVVEAYDALPVPVLKADFFRYLILHARGGIYSDIDTEAIKSAAEWLPESVPASEVGLIIGIEADPDREDWAEWYSRRIQFCQWTIQAKPGHPTLRKIVTTITEDTLRMKRAGLLRGGGRLMDKSIVEFTGPAVFTDKVFEYFNDPDYFAIDEKSRSINWKDFTNADVPKKVGDVVVLPITSFSPGVGQMGAGDTDDPMAFVRHDFGGSWKEDWEKIKPIVEKPTPSEAVEEPTTHTPSPIETF